MQTLHFEHIVEENVAAQVKEYVPQIIEQLATLGDRLKHADEIQVRKIEIEVKAMTAFLDLAGRLESANSTGAMARR